MSWIKAVKIWNDKREGKKYMIPRKGTEEHAQVMSIMKGQQNGKGLRQVGKGDKLSQDGGSLRKALNFASKNPAEFVKLVNQQQTGRGLNQVGGFLPAFIIPFIPAITTALGAFATGAAGAAGALAVDAIAGDGLNKKQTAFLKAVEGERKTSKPNKARDARIMRKYKKHLKTMSGSGIAEIVLDNPKEAFEVGKVIFGTPTAPTLKDGKVVIPPTPLENLWNSIFN
jgi:hypothetical protein